jgi:hypothetical protein
MAQDPYGYVDSAPRGGSGDAAQAMWFGVAAAMLGSVGICFCYMPYFVSLPLGLYATVKGYRSLGGDSADDTKGRAMATAGMISGLLSSIVSGMFVVFWLMYLLVIVLYVVLAFVMVGAAAISGTPPQ